MAETTSNSGSCLLLASSYLLVAVLIQPKIEQIKFRASVHLLMVMLMKRPKGKWDWGLSVGEETPVDSSSDYSVVSNDYLNVLIFYC